jgi:plastocyanin
LRIPATSRGTRLAVLTVTGVAALSLVATGCGDDDEEPTVATTTPTTTTGATGGTGATGAAGGGESVDISETDFALDPDEVTAKAGTVIFKVTNDGDATHNLEVEGNGVEEELPQDLSPGDSGALTVDLEPGDYTMYCPVGNHREQGMEGTVTVE